MSYFCMFITKYNIQVVIYKVYLQYKWFCTSKEGPNAGHQTGSLKKPEEPAVWNFNFNTAYNL